MKKIKILFVAMLSTLATFPAGILAAENISDSLTLIHAGQVLSVPGEKPKSKQSLLIRGAYIESIHDGFITPQSLGLKDVKVIDLSEQFVMPGLMDTHVHLTSDAKPGGLQKSLNASDADLAIDATLNAEKLLDAGFTTVMDMGNGSRTHEKAIYAVRDGISQGIIAGPEILAAGSPISARGSSRTSRYVDNLHEVLGPEAVCSGPSSCRDAVREQIDRSADFINFYNSGSMLTSNSPAQTFTIEEMRAIIEQAHSLNRVVVADGGNSPNSASGIDEAILAGVDIIDTVTYPGPKTFDLLKANGGYFAPHVYALVAAVGDSIETLSEGSMGWLPEPVLLELFAMKQLKPSAMTGYRAGVKLLLSADSGVFSHGLNAHELIEYSKLGIKPMDALMAATVNVAAAFRIFDRTGSLVSGKEADLVAFGVSPLEDMNAVLEPVFVMSNGRIHHIKP